MKQEIENTNVVRILLADDNPADTMLLATLFQELAPQTHVRVVHDGAAAIDFLSRQLVASTREIDVVLLDLNLPKKSGIEVLAAIRSEPKLRDLPVYVLTTSSSAEDRARVTALGVNGFLIKPAEILEFEALIHRLTKEEFPKLNTGAAMAAKFRADTPATGERRVQVASDGFRLLVEAVKDYAIFMLDPDGYILTWNEGAQRIKQYAPHEIIGKHFSTFYTEADIRSGHPEFELREAAREGRYEEEGWRVRKDGTRLWASVTITALRDPAGTLIGFGKVTRDMTERKRAEENLRESEERFRVLVEGVRDYAIFMLDPTGHIVSWNKGAERAKGYQASEILGKHFSVFYTEEAKARRHPDYELAEATEKGSYEEVGIRVRKDGSTFWANVLITALYDPGGNLRGFAKITRDITAQKKAEQAVHELNADLERRVRARTQELELSKQAVEQSNRQLEMQREELLRSNSDLRQFAYVASHDLQEPLRMVVSYLQLLQRKASDRLNEQERQFISFAVGGALRMRTLVQDLLSYARIERSSELPESICDMNEVVTAARANLDAAISSAGAKIEVENLPPVQGECGQLIQVLQNLIGNAITYSPAGRVPQIRIGTRDTDDAHCTLFVADNGIGISPEYFEKIFIIFQRLHSDHEKYPGTGIGLAICKKIVERHRGKIWVESQPGQGSTFLFTLPKPKKD